MSAIKAVMVTGLALSVDMAVKQWLNPKVAITACRVTKYKGSSKRGTEAVMAFQRAHFFMMPQLLALVQRVAMASALAPIPLGFLI